MRSREAITAGPGGLTVAWETWTEGAVFDRNAQTLARPGEADAQRVGRKGKEHGTPCCEPTARRPVRVVWMV